MQLPYTSPTIIILRFCNVIFIIPEPVLDEKLHSWYELRISRSTCVCDYCVTCPQFQTEKEDQAGHKL